MTLQNGLVEGRSAFLWSDTGWLDAQTGEMKAVGMKGFIGDIFPFAGIWTSNGGDPFAMVDVINEAVPICVPSLLEAASDALRAYADTGHVGSLLIATWQGEPDLHLIRSVDGLPGDAEPAFEPISCYHHVCIGNGDAEIETMRIAGLTRRRMHKVIDRQIQMPFAFHESFGIAPIERGIRGDIIEWEVSQRGVETRVLRSAELEAA